MKEKLLGILMVAVMISMTGVVYAAGTITGTVKFDGEAPKFKEIKMDADPVCLSHHTEPVFPQTLALGEGNGMGNVIVRIKNAPKVDSPVPAEPLVIDQKGCNYHPHVAVIRAGQKVKILNPDGTLHNVHAMSKVNPEFNVAMPKFRTEIEKVFEKPESIFALKCDVHPWMTAWVTVSDNAFTVVTDANGKFELKDLPDGTYEIEAWHEKLGTKTTSVKIEGGAAQVADFSFAAPKKS